MCAAIITVTRTQPYASDRFEDGRYIPFLHTQVNVTISNVQMERNFVVYLILYVNVQFHRDEIGGFIENYLGKVWGRRKSNIGRACTAWEIRTGFALRVLRQRLRATSYGSATARDVDAINRTGFLLTHMHFIKRNYQYNI